MVCSVLVIEANPAIDGTLDRTASAKAIIAKLQIIEYFLAEAERNAASGNLYVAALDEALSFARGLYEFAIIDNETPIAARQESIKGARNGGRLRSKGVKPRNREMAQEFQNGRGGRNLSDTALMEKMELGRGLRKKSID